ncbi:MAG: FecR domain-containing protein [Bacteroides sp.]|uniref:FecR family protein n=2 Tax=Bacteroides sp. TaxID=29523 RepID=UPI002FCA39BC
MKKPTEQQINDVLAGVATGEVAQNVAKWFGTDEGSDYLSTSIDQMGDGVKPGFEELYVGHEIASESIYRRIKQAIHRKRIRRILFRAAAVLVPFIVLLGLFQQVNSRVDLFGNSDYEEIIVPKGERIQLLFQDGTRVYMNSDSRLKYPRQFGLGTREVYLTGEAYFVVSKLKNRPFIVNLGGSSVHVLGTSFNVQAYPESQHITVCLDDGKVDLTLSSQQKYTLEPGEKLLYNKKDNSCVISKILNNKLHSVWKQNLLVFKDTPLDEVLKVLNRWYNVDFFIEDDAVRKYDYTLTSENMLLEQVLLDLEKIAPVRFEYQKKERRVVVRIK